MGNMGLPMAANLAKNGFEVKGFDISAQTLEKAEGMVREFLIINRELNQSLKSKRQFRMSNS
jgi:UDP-N-acetyl-D-mannosaminuronate dehydrogenase